MIKIIIKLVYFKKFSNYSLCKGSLKIRIQEKGPLSLIYQNTNLDYSPNMGDNNTKNKFDLNKNSGFRKAKMFIVQKLLLNSYGNIKYKHSDTIFRLNIIKI